MKSEQTLDKLLDGIKGATARMDLAELTKLSKMAQRVQAIDAQVGALEQELQQIENSIGVNPNVRTVSVVSGPTTGIARATEKSGGEVVVQVNWRLCKIDRPEAKISERKVSDTLVAFMEEIHATLGVEALRKLTSLRVSRGPLVSLHPEADYVNNKTGAIYVNHPIGDTGFYVLTHSGTPEKITAMNEAWRCLGLTPGALSIRRN